MASSTTLSFMSMPAFCSMATTASSITGEVVGWPLSARCVHESFVPFF